MAKLLLQPVPGRYDPAALPLAPTYTNVTDAQLFAWREAHWANWYVRGRYLWYYGTRVPCTATACRACERFNSDNNDNDNDNNNNNNEKETSRKLLTHN